MSLIEKKQIYTNFACEYKTFTILFENPRFYMFSRRVLLKFSLCSPLCKLPLCTQESWSPRCWSRFCSRSLGPTPRQCTREHMGTPTRQNPRGCLCTLSTRARAAWSREGFSPGRKWKKFPTIHEHSSRDRYNL